MLGVGSLIFDEPSLTQAVAHLSGNIINNVVLLAHYSIADLIDGCMPLSCV